MKRRHLPSDRISVRVRNVNTGIAKPKAGKGRRQRHIFAIEHIAAISDSTTQCLSNQLQGPLRPHICDRVRAWYWIASRQHLENEIGLKQKLLLVSRPASSSPAVGYLAKHNEQQKALVESALGKIEY